MTRPPDELPPGWVTCQPAHWEDVYWMEQEDSETRRLHRRYEDEMEEEEG